MITIVDYGVGNLQALQNVYKRLNVPSRRASTPAELAGATQLILPGVGAFDHAMDLLDSSGMRDPLERLVRQERIPVLGICVGMQMLMDGSNEGARPGLGWIPGRVRAFRSAAPPGLMVPHLGWNDVRPVKDTALFEGQDAAPRFYFLHSFYVECAAPDDVAATSQYGFEFACAVQAGNIYGVQFHPEKSHEYGTRLLKSFSEVA